MERPRGYVGRAEQWQEGECGRLTGGNGAIWGHLLQIITAAK